MKIEVARRVVRRAFRSAGELQQLLPVLKAECSPEEYRIFAKAIAKAVAGIALEVTNKVLAEHPELEAEIDAAIAKDGQY